MLHTQTFLNHMWNLWSVEQNDYYLVQNETKRLTLTYKFRWICIHAKALHNTLFAAIYFNIKSSELEPQRNS